MSANVLRSHERVLQIFEVRVRNAVHVCVTLLLQLGEEGKVVVTVGDEEVAFTLIVGRRARDLATLLGQTLLGRADREKTQSAMA